MSDKHNHKREELAEAKKRIKELEKELTRKDKALAELAALIALEKTGVDLGGPRGRLISEACKRQVIKSVEEAVRAGARKSSACEMLGITVRTLQHWKRKGPVDRRRGAAKTVTRKLNPEERQEVLEVCSSERFRDLTPHEIVPTLAQEGLYVASESSFYRVLRAANQVCFLQVGIPQSCKEGSPGTGWGI